MWHWTCEAKTWWIISLFKFYLLLFPYNSTWLEGNRFFSLTNTAFQADWLPIFIIRIFISKLFVSIFATILTTSPKLKNKHIFEWLGRSFNTLTDLRNMISILCVSANFINVLTEDKDTMLEWEHTGCVHLFPTLLSQVVNWTSAMSVVFTQWKLTNATDQVFFFLIKEHHSTFTCIPLYWVYCKNKFISSLTLCGLVTN